MKQLTRFAFLCASAGLVPALIVEPVAAEGGHDLSALRTPAKRVMIVTGQDYPGHKSEKTRECK